MTRYRTAEVFVPGGMPRLTYVSRAERKLEHRLRSAKDIAFKLVAVTGATKSGKTVLVNRGREDLAGLLERCDHRLDD